MKVYGNNHKPAVTVVHGNNASPATKKVRLANSLRTFRSKVGAPSQALADALAAMGYNIDAATVESYAESALYDAMEEQDMDRSERRQIERDMKTEDTVILAIGTSGAAQLFDDYLTGSFKISPEEFSQALQQAGLS